MKPEDSIFSAATERLSVGLLLLPDSNLLSLAACVDPLRAANRRADKKLFEWTFLTPTDAPVALTSGIEISGQPISAKDSFDLLIVVAEWELGQHQQEHLQLGDPQQEHPFLGCATDQPHLSGSSVA